MIRASLTILALVEVPAVHKVFSARVFVLALIAILVMAACGEGAAPTVVPQGPTPTSAVTAPASPTPQPEADAGNDTPLATGTGYPAELAKKHIAENFMLPGMTYGDGETPQYGGTANFSNKAELPNDDPTLNASITLRNVLGPLVGNGGLVGTKRRANAEPRPVLAESWTASDNFKVWTFKLRPEVKWHDGTPLVADDIKFSYDLNVNPPKGRRVGSSLANALPNFQEIQVVDQHTVKLIFKVGSPHLLETLASESNEVTLPRHLAQKELDKGNLAFGLAPLGWVSTGPYKFSDHVRGSSFTVVRFDGYWEKDEQGRALPYLDSVVNTPIPDRAVALGAFRAGRLDAMSRGIGTNLDPREVILVKRTFDTKVWFHRYPYLAYGVSMNVMKPPFDDVRARKAVNLYLNREEGAAKMQGGFAFSSGFLSPASWWHSYQYTEWPGFNPATKAQDQVEAKRLMTEAGLVGVKVPISCRTDYLFMCEFQESVLRGVGFEPSIQLMDVNQYSEAVRTLQFVVEQGASCNYLQPGQCMTSLVTTAESNRYNDPKIDEFQSIILNSTDPIVRRQALWDAERYFLLEKAYEAKFYREEVVGPYRTYLKGSIVPGAQAHQNTDRATDWIDKSLK